MHNASTPIAEHVLRFFTTKEAASSVVGDLVEAAPQQGSAWLWLSILKIILWLSWRRLLAFVAAFFIGNWALGALQIPLFGANGHWPAHQIPLLWKPFFAVLDGAVVVLCMVMSYAVVRYGVRDGMTQLGLLWTGFFNLILWEWWRPGALALSIILLALLIAASLCTRERREASCAVLTAVAVGLASWFGSMYLTSRWQHFIYPGPWRAAEMRAHPSVGWVALLTYVAAVWVSTTTLSRLHRWAAEQ
jgi:hypothetical protein